MLYLYIVRATFLFPTFPRLGGGKRADLKSIDANNSGALTLVFCVDYVFWSAFLEVKYKYWDWIWCMCYLFCLIFCCTVYIVPDISIRHLCVLYHSICYLGIFAGGKRSAWGGEHMSYHFFLFALMSCSIFLNYHFTLKFCESFISFDPL